MIVVNCDSGFDTMCVKYWAFFISIVLRNDLIVFVVFEFVVLLLLCLLFGFSVDSILSENRSLLCQVRPAVLFVSVVC